MSDSPSSTTARISSTAQKWSSEWQHLRTLQEPNKYGIGGVYEVTKVGESNDRVRILKECAQRELLFYRRARGLRAGLRRCFPLVECLHMEAAGGYIVMERLSMMPRLSLAQVYDLAVQLLTALEVLHTVMRNLHGDVSPHNIGVRDDGSYVLFDFSHSMADPYPLSGERGPPSNFTYGPLEQHRRTCVRLHGCDDMQSLLYVLLDLVLRTSGKALPWALIISPPPRTVFDFSPEEEKIMHAKDALTSELSMSPRPSPYGCLTDLLATIVVKCVAYCNDIPRSANPTAKDYTFFRSQFALLKDGAATAC